MNDTISALTKDAVTLLERHMLLEQLVMRELMATASENESLSPEQKQQIHHNLCQRYKVSDPKDLEDSLRERGIEPGLAFWQAALPIKLHAYAAKTFKPKAEARFLERKNELDRVVYSLLRVRNGDLAQELYLRIAEGEANFADLAGRFSEGVEKSTNGIVGPAPMMQAHPRLAELLRTSKPGELREPIQIDEWFLVVRLESYTPASLDEATKDQLAQELFQAWAKEEATRKIQVLKTTKAVNGTHQ
jgi:parvulin-like peptidyl-prolyl isomerase